MWTTSAARVGYKRKVGNGRKVFFWEDIWLGQCSLVILFWDLYVIVNEHLKTIAKVWDGVELKFSLRRSVSPVLFNMWIELVELIKTVGFSDEEDSPIWLFHSSGTYSVSSFYGIVNNGGVILIHTPEVWKLHVPPRIHIFLWLLSNDRLLTRDNLSKRRTLDDDSCLFCNEHESAKQLFFECVVATSLWEVVSDILKLSIGKSFESVARWWLSDNKNSVLNIFSSATLWTLWLVRNEMCFQELRWPGVKDLLRRLRYTIRSWHLLCPDKHYAFLDANLLLLYHHHGELLRIAWN
jgi:hypothetical protein